MKLSYKITSIAATLLIVSSAQAQQNCRPPAEAFSACASSSEGQSCSFNVPEREIKGKCITPPHRKELVCAPAGRRHGKGKGDMKGEAPASEQNVEEGAGG